MLGLKVHRLSRVVDEGKASGSTTTKLGPHAKDDDLLLISLVHDGELLGELCLGDVGPRGVNDVQDALPSLKETVGDELASSKGDGGRGVLWVHEGRYEVRVGRRLWGDGQVQMCVCE